MKNYRITLLGCLLCFFAHLKAQQTLQQEIQNLLKDSLFEQTEVGIAVYDLTAQQSLYTYQANKRYRPASIQKVLTCIESLHRLSKQHLFKTQIYYTGKIKKKTLKGDLYVVGEMDPLFDQENMQHLIDQLSQAGIRRIKGKIRGDVSFMDSLHWGYGWCWDDVQGDFQPYMSPLMYHGGTVKITAFPNKKKGAPARLLLEPKSNYYTLHNFTKSRSSLAPKFKANRNWLEQQNQITLEGNVSRKRESYISLHRSQDFFMHVFIEQLQKRGISYVESYDYADLPPHAVKIAETTHTLKEVVTKALKESNNLCAEAVLLHLAKDSLQHKHLGIGQGVVTLYNRAQALGFKASDCTLVDGCGLSNYNYISPQLMIGFLRFAYQHPAIFDCIYQAMPIAGVDGTLWYRMRQGDAHCNVHAKTGTMTGVSSLAGYLRAANNHMLAFVIINQNHLSARVARKFQDKLCQLLVELH
jgi:D-alanyl-D-alanine carboxypeptidase/D-alanyl-D-alanine-endopeptidase (penicillin-binding protein 4)